MNKLSAVIELALDYSLESCFLLHLGEGLYKSKKLQSSFGHIYKDIVDWTISSSLKVKQLFGLIVDILNRGMLKTKLKLMQKYFSRDRPISLSSLQVLMSISLPTT